MKDPAYYRDLLNQILEADDSPAPMTSPEEIAKQKIEHLKKLGKTPKWFKNLFYDPIEDEYSWRATGSWMLPDGHIINDIFCGMLRLNDPIGYSLSATVAERSAYKNLEDHPYGDNDVIREMHAILMTFGFPDTVEILWSEWGMQDGEYLHFDSNLDDIIINWLKNPKA